MAKKPVKSKAKPALKAKKKKPTVKAKKKALDDFVDAIDKFDIDFDIDEKVWTFGSSVAKETTNIITSVSNGITATYPIKDFDMDYLPDKYTATVTKGYVVDRDNIEPKFNKHSHECLMIHDELIVDLKYYNNGNDQKVVGDIVPANGYKSGQMSLESVDGTEAKLVYKNRKTEISMDICDGYDLYLLMKYWFETADTNHMAKTVYYTRMK